MLLELPELNPAAWELTSEVGVPLLPEEEPPEEPLEELLEYSEEDEADSDLLFPCFDSRRGALK